ncbi:MAG: arginine deiminase-related protein [Candidatus Tumulicola sp.]
MTSVLMCPPTYYTVRDVKNPFMRPDVGVDHRLAARQWSSLRAAFSRLGVTPLIVEPVEDLEDMVFAANQVFVGSGVEHSRFIVPSRMRYESRQREVPFFVDWFAERGFDVIDLGLEAKAGEFLEGHGDLMWHPNARVVWAGHGFRSSAPGIERFARAMHPEGIRVVPIQLADPTFYHLDTCFSPLNAEAALLYPDALAGESLDTLRREWKRVHEVTRDDAMRFACNGVAVGRHYITSYLSPSLRNVMAAEGLEPLLLDTSEFEKAGGSVFCMKAVLSVP